MNTDSHTHKQDSLAVTIGQQIRRYRKELGLTQTLLAERIGSSQRAIVRLEKGQHDPNLATLRKIAGALDMDLHVSFDTDSSNPGLTIEPNQVKRQLHQIKGELKAQIAQLLTS